MKVNYNKSTEIAEAHLETKDGNLDLNTWAMRLLMRRIN